MVSFQMKMKDQYSGQAAVAVGRMGFTLSEANYLKANCIVTNILKPKIACKLPTEKLKTENCLSWLKKKSKS